MGSARFDRIFDLMTHEADAWLRCPCGHDVTLDAVALIRMIGMRATRRWHEVEAVMRCSRCGHRGVGMRIIPVPRPSKGLRTIA